MYRLLVSASRDAVAQPGAVAYRRGRLRCGNMVDRKRRNMPQRCQKGERHHSKPYMRDASVVLSVHSRRELCTLARRSHGQRLTPAQREAQSSANAETLRRERRAQACALNHESCSLPACHRSCLHAPRCVNMWPKCCGATQGGKQRHEREMCLDRSCSHC